ncbi:hypothetical protein [Cohaesibacter gelatinilyticus]|nr:hypothetical protein [Cohaesibacter gelatinilyticus]
MTKVQGRANLGKRPVHHETRYRKALQGGLKKRDIGQTDYA